MQGWSLLPEIESVIGNETSQTSNKEPTNLKIFFLTNLCSIQIGCCADFAERGFDRLSSVARQKYLFDKTKYIDASEYSKDNKGFTEGC